MIPNGIITLTTDFGLADGFVGVMKGVIYSINRHALIVDITHHIPAQQVEVGSFILQNSYHYFPKGTIHIAVVDPGVGSQRKILAVAANDHFFLAPDNQILKYIFYKNETLAVYEVLNQTYFCSRISQTFHGRDIFAPVAAHLSKGLSLEKLGSLTTNYNRGLIPAPKKMNKKIIGSILHVDNFGNLITNVEERHLSINQFVIKLGKIMIDGLSHSYSDVPSGKSLAIIGSSGFLEIAVREGNAAQQFALTTGDSLEVIFD